MALVDTASAGAWSTLKLSPFVSATVDALGFSHMTPVQASVIPLFLNQHKDVVVQAVTGSGKTLAFVIPLLEKLARRETALKDEQVGGIIVCPTRELAIQTHKVVESFLASQASLPSSSKVRHLSSAQLLIGGNSTLRDDIKTFLSSKPDIFIGTPGRLEEFLLGSSSLSSASSASSKKGKKPLLPTSSMKSVCSVKEVEMFILDEADRLLELGFQASLNRILGILPKQRRTGCFSATMSEGIGELCRVGLRNPVRIVVKVERKNVDNQDGGERSTPATLQHTYVLAETEQKMAKLLQFLKTETEATDTVDGKKIIVYFATCACVDYFFKLLKPLSQLSSFTLYPLHGQQTPSKRTSTYTSFISPPSSHKAPHQLLLCTDIAVRGLDLPDVDLVIQYDPPQDPKQFNHRAGRTARAGRKGKNTVFLCRSEGGREEEYLEFLARRGIGMKAEKGLDQIEKAQMDKLSSQMKALILKDRDLHDKSIKAFVSFVRSYSKHEASYIFSLSNYDLIGLAKCFALLRLPKMPELKNAKGREDWVDAEVDWDTYAFADKIREKQRLASLAEYKAKKAATASDGQVTEGATEEGSKKRGPLPAWSHKLEAKERKEQRREKKARKRAFLESQEGGGISDNQEKDEEEEEEPPKKKGTQVSAVQAGKRALGKELIAAKRKPKVLHSGSEEDNDDYGGTNVKEERAAKRVRKGKMEMQPFDMAFGAED